MRGYEGSTYIPCAGFRTACPEVPANPFYERLCSLQERLDCFVSRSDYVPTLSCAFVLLRFGLIMWVLQHIRTISLAPFERLPLILADSAHDKLDTVLQQCLKAIVRASRHVLRV